TVFRLFYELQAWQLTGAQAISHISVKDLKKIKIPNPNIKLDSLSINKIFNDFDKSSRLSIFEEFGSSELNSIDLTKVQKDRINLDNFIMNRILGLTKEEQLDVYIAVADIVKSRLEKAKSVEKKKKNKDGINVEAFIDTVMERIGEETLGSFYKKNILKQKKLKKIKLPIISSNIILHIDKELMGWRLYYSNKDFIICDSEEEARFIKIFLDTEIEELSVPTDINYLSSIISNLEKLKEKIDIIINESLETIYSTKLKNNLKHQLIREIIKT
ncbi:MAG: hypothetical protein H8D45_01405, partial [Bacteroidetes bacterium]|nr:hypothetical protein [Bacteroidota bacterium]